MLCKCGQRLRVTNSLRAGPHAVTQRLQCPACAMVYTAVTVIVYEGVKYGKNYWAVANRLAETPAPYQVPKAIRAAVEGLPANKTTPG